VPEDRAGTDTAAQPSSETRPNEGPAEAQPAPPGQRLVIVTKDGEIVVREMSKVRRVTVDSNQLVVTLKDGKVIRHQLSNVERMSIEP
jgi:argonaute-like protein implicated in RNA metabolism and viral defense